MKRYHDYGNFYKMRHLISAGLQFQGLVHYHHGRGAWERAGRHGAVEVAEHSAHRSAGSRKRKPLSLVWVLETSAPTPNDFLQQGHTYFSKVTPTNPFK